MWTIWPPFESIGSDATDRELGQLSVRAIEASRQGVANRDPRDETPFRPVLDLAGVRSYRAFLRGAKGVDLNEEGGVLTVTPSRPPLGVEKGIGFVGMTDQNLQCTLEDIDVVGATVREALSRSIRQPVSAKSSIKRSS